MLHYSYRDAAVHPPELLLRASHTPKGGQHEKNGES